MSADVEYKCDGCGMPIAKCYCPDSDFCYDCGGRGWKVVCIDDLCHGEDECIHGDPPVPCRTCNRKGQKEDRLYY